MPGKVVSYGRRAAKGKRRTSRRRCRWRCRARPVLPEPAGTLIGSADAGWQLCRGIGATGQLPRSPSCGSVETAWSGAGKAEHSVNASKRIRVTAASPRLGTGCRAPLGEIVCGRWRQACRNPCFRAQCWVRSFQPLFSNFQRSWPNRRTCGVGKARGSRVVTHNHS